MRTILTLFFLVLVSGGVLIALSNSAKPGDVLFPIDLLVEDIQLILSSESKRVELYVRFSEERVGEFTSLIDEVERTNDDGDNVSAEKLFESFVFTRDYIREKRKILIEDGWGILVARLNLLTDRLIELSEKTSFIHSLRLLEFKNRFGEEYGISNVPKNDVECMKGREGEERVGLIFCTDEVEEGYVLIQTNSLPSRILLINTKGELVHVWSNVVFTFFGSHLFPDGSIINARESETTTSFLSSGGGGTGILERISWDGMIEWRIEIADNRLRLHHGIEVLPNGNILAIAWEYKSPQEALAAGYDPEKITDDGLWPDVILEIKPIGKDDFEIVWQWHFWDNLVQDWDPSLPNYGVISENYDKLDINFESATHGETPADLLHCNGIDYHEELDQIALSCANEVYVIDHSPKRKGIVFRSGEIQVESSQFSRSYFSPHYVSWSQTQEKETSVLFTGLYSPTGSEYDAAFWGFEIPLSILEREKAHELEPGEYATYVSKTFLEEIAEGNSLESDVQNQTLVRPRFTQLPGGNILTVSGEETAGIITQVNQEGEGVWQYVVPIDTMGKVIQRDSKAPIALLNNAIWYPYDYLRITQ